MKIAHSKETDSFVAGASNTEEMKLDDSAALFYLLSEGLYNNPELASVREIITNASDAHNENGITKPFNINVDDDFVTIQDFGGGIPHDLFDKYYKGLGGSSKRDSVISTGGMGIGKIAPLSITEMMMVTNRNAGVSKTWSITRGNQELNGKPLIGLMNESTCMPNDNGLSVIIPINGRYKQTLANVMYVVKAGNINANVITGTQGTLNYPVHETSYGSMIYHNGHNSILVRWGVNTYPMDNLRIALPDPIKEILSYYGGSISMVVDIPLTETLSITPSRESLIKTDMNIEVITKYIKRLGNFIAQYRKQHIKNALQVLVSQKNYVKLERPRIYDAEKKAMSDKQTMSIEEFITSSNCVNTINLTVDSLKHAIHRDYRRDWSEDRLLGLLSIYHRSSYNINKDSYLNFKKPRKVASLLAKYGLRDRHISHTDQVRKSDLFAKMLVVDFIVVGDRQDVEYYKKQTKDAVYISCLKATKNDELIKDLQRLLPHTVVVACDVRPNALNKVKKKREPFKSDLVSLVTFNSDKQVMVTGRKHCDKWGISSVKKINKLAKIYDLDPSVLYDHIIKSPRYGGNAKSIDDVCVVTEKHSGRLTVSITNYTLVQFVYGIDPLTIVAAHQLRELGFDNCETKGTDVLLGGTNSLVNLIRKEFDLPILKVSQLTIDRLNRLQDMEHNSILSSSLFSRGTPAIFTLKGVEQTIKFVDHNHIEYEHRKLLLKCEKTSEIKTLLKIIRRPYGSVK